VIVEYWTSANGQRVYSVKLGKVAFAGAPDELKGDREKLKHLFL